MTQTTSTLTRAGEQAKNLTASGKFQRMTFAGLAIGQDFYKYMNDYNTFVKVSTTHARRYSRDNNTHPVEVAADLKVLIPAREAR